MSRSITAQAILSGYTKALCHRWTFGIVNPVEIAEKEYQTSLKITEELVDLIYLQETSLVKLDKSKIKGRVDSLKIVKELRLKKELAEIMSEVDETTRESLQLVQEHGSGAWLTCLPIQQLGYAYSNQDFRDAVHLRYGWDIPNTPRSQSYSQL